MRFPEAALRSYLRVFRSDAEVEQILDRVAQRAIDTGSSDELEMFAFAHWELAEDRRLTPQMEAVVLVEEVGLSRKETAVVLGISVTEVDHAVGWAWTVDAGLEPEAPEDGDDEPQQQAEEPPPVEGAPQVEEAPPSDAEHRSQASPVHDPPPVLVAPPRRRRLPVILLLLVAAALIAFATLALSQVGTERLLQRGIDPVLALAVVVGFVVAGAALLRAGAPPRNAHETVDEPATGRTIDIYEEGASAQEPPAPGEQDHDADEGCGPDHQQ